MKRLYPYAVLWGLSILLSIQTCFAGYGDRENDRPLFTQAPALGIDGFDVTATTNTVLFTAQPSGTRSDNVVSSGFDAVVNSTGTGNVSLTVPAVNGYGTPNPSTDNNGWLNAQRAATTNSISEVDLFSDDGSAFNLQSLAVECSMNVSTDVATITITGYRSGTQVGSAVVTNNVASSNTTPLQWVDVTTNFKGIDEIKVTIADATNSADFVTRLGIDALDLVGPAVTNPALSNAQAGVAYTPENFTASGGTSPYTFSKASGSLPAGMSLSSSGALSGTPTQVGTFTFSVQATDATGLTSAASAATLTVTPPTLTLSPASLSDGTYQSSYTAVTFSAVGGNAPYTYSAVGLPPGITINTSSGTLSGTPTAAGTYAVSVTVTDATTGTGAPFSTTNFITWVIDKVPLTVTAVNATKVYGAMIPNMTVNYSGFVGGDNVSSLTTQPTLSVGATARSPVGSYTITASGVVDPNYAITYVGATLQITPAPLSITAGNATMPYGGPLPAFTASYSGFVNSDNASSLTTQPTLSTTATTSSLPGTYPISAGSAVDPNYTITYNTGTLTVGKATLTVTADNKMMPLGGPLPALTVSYSGFVGSDNVSSLTTQPTASTSATAGSPSGNYTITPSGGSAANYTFSYVDGTLTVQKATLTITALPAGSTYGSPLVSSGSLQVSYSGFINGDNSSSLTVPPTVINTAFTGAPAGTYALIPSGAVDPNYTIVYVDGTYTITPASLQISGIAETKTYGSANPTLVASYTGFVNGDIPASLAPQPTVTTSATASSPVGTYPISVSGAFDPNYTITYMPGTLTVGQAPLTVTAASGSMGYGSTVPTLGVTYSGFVNGDNASSLTTQPTVNTTATSASPIGTYPTIATGAADPNYAFTYVPGVLTVGQAVLNITADNASMTYGGTVPALGVTYSGFVNGDNAASLTTAPTIGTTATTASPAGAYPITASGAVDPNYTITYTPGVLTVGNAPLTITADNNVMTYGGAVPALGYSVTGFVNGDNTSSFTTLPTVITPASSSSPVGIYPTLAIGAVIPNYDISYNNGNLTINPAALTVTADNATMTYGGTLPSLGVSYSGFVNGDDPSDLTTPATAATTATSASAAGTYPVTASGATSGNYTISYVPGTLTIDPAALNITANAETKTYGTADPALTYVVSGLINGDNSSILTGSLSRDPGNNVGTYPITEGTLSAGGNYTIDYIGNNLTITRAAQQISWGQSLMAGCNGSTQLQLTAATSSGLPITYTSSDAAVASVNGDMATLGQLGSAVITASQAGDSNYLPATDVTDTVIEQAASLVQVHWGNVLIFDNTSSDYDQWQWYKNGSAIPGATGQYYSETPSLNGQYYVVATNDNGGQVQTCPLSVTGSGAAPGGIKVFPNPVNRGGIVTVVSNYTAAALQGAQMQILDMGGMIWQTITNVQPSMQVTMPAGGGIYIINLQLTNGQKASVNVLVGQ